MHFDPLLNPEALVCNLPKGSRVLEGLSSKPQCEAQNDPYKDGCSTEAPRGP